MFATKKTMQSIGEGNQKILVGCCEAYVHGHKENFQKIILSFHKHNETHLMQFSHHQYRESIIFRAAEPWLK